MAVLGKQETTKYANHAKEDFEWLQTFSFFVVCGDYGERSSLQVFEILQILVSGACFFVDL